MTSVPPDLLQKAMLQTAADTRKKNNEEHALESRGKATSDCGQASKVSLPLQHYME
jgi:hypothetical protein